MSAVRTGLLIYFYTSNQVCDIGSAKTAHPNSRGTANVACKRIEKCTGNTDNMRSG